MFGRNGRPDIRRAAGDCRLRSLSTGNVLEIGVPADPGVGGTEELVKGVEGVRMLLPPHLWHLGFSPTDPEPSLERLLRRPLRFG